LTSLKNNTHKIRYLSSSTITFAATATTTSSSSKGFLKMSEITTDLAKLQNVQVRGPLTLSNYAKIEEVPETTLATPIASKENGSVVFIIRRLGCPVCRTAALLISSVSPQLQAKGISMNCVTFQTGDELRQFLAAGYWIGDHYLDAKRESYAIAGTTGLMGAFKLFSSFFTSLSDAFKTRLKNISGNNNEISTVYSTILGIQGGKIVFEQRYVEDPNIDGLLKSLGIEGEEFKQAMESVKMNLEAKGDEIVGPACNLKTKQCE
jgi:hypothetical protein